MSNDIPAVSVIIPVYNAAEFLKDGLNSLLKQTLREIEIICVDDGSTDGSLVILKEFEKADARIRVIHQENQGAGAARNNGMDVARGKYLAFLDADDFFEKNMLKAAYDRAEETEAEVCVFNADLYDHTEKVYKKCTWAFRKQYFPETAGRHCWMKSRYLLKMKLMKQVRLSALYTLKQSPRRKAASGW